jgi:hypothetical protein
VTAKEKNIRNAPDFSLLGHFVNALSKSTAIPSVIKKEC